MVQRARGLDLLVHLEEARLHALVREDRHAALDARLGVVDRQLEARRGRSRRRSCPCRRWPGTGRGRRRRDTLRAARPDESAGTFRSSKKISPWLRARWPILSVGLPLLTPAFVERHDEHAAAEAPVAHVDRAEQRRGLGDRAVRDPGRLLAGDHELVAVAAGDAIGPLVVAAGMTERAVEVDQVRAMIRLGDGPATQRSGAESARSAPDCPTSAPSWSGKPATPRLIARPVSPQPSSSPTMQRMRACSAGEARGPRRRRAQAQLAILAEDVPEDRVRGR